MYRFLYPAATIITAIQNLEKIYQVLLIILRIMSAFRIAEY
ncbi:hypothetical protein ATC1_131029 [Flexilinea flocculi]|jgi:hypothetical protein|uniref:Uncharacterized protein n=1 Tax=Flexilinea flocculi TaxID=1678840 RepID=A0A0S7BRP7_9CHLR|nr:hypothetical protein ATC1_131029 [Flexilinea flocculi]